MELGLELSGDVDKRGDCVPVSILVLMELGLERVDSMTYKAIVKV